MLTKAWSEPARGCFHLVGEFAIADRPRVPDLWREVISQSLREGPEQRFRERVIIGELDAIADMADAEVPDGRQNLARLMQVVDDDGKHRHQLHALKAHVVLEHRPEMRIA